MQTLVGRCFLSHETSSVLILADFFFFFVTLLVASSSVSRSPSDEAAVTGITGNLI